MPYIGNITQDFNVSNAMLDTDSVTSIKIVDGTIEGADIAANLDLSDSQKIRFGAGNDLQIYHDGSNSYVADVGTGNMNINGSAVQILNPSATEVLAKFIQNAAVELYYDNSKKFYTTSTGAYIENRLDIGGANNGWSYPKPLNVQGSSGAILALRNWDTTTYAADTNTSIDFSLRTGNTGNQGGSCEIRAFKENGTNGNNARGLAFYTGANGGQPQKRLNITSDGNVQIPADNKYLQLGASQDLNLYHDGSHSYITNATGALHIHGKSGENSIVAVPDGAVNLYYDNSKKFETTSGGGTLTGDFTVTGNIYGGNHITVQDSDGSSDMLKIGTDEDIRIYHYNNNSYIRQHTDKPLTIGGTSTGQSLYLSPKDGEYAAVFKPNAEVELYYDNSKKFQTGHGGEYGSFQALNGNNGWDGMAVGDSKFVFMGSTSQEAVGIWNDQDNEWMVKCVRNAETQLQYNGSKKFETTSDGATFSGSALFPDNQRIKVGGDASTPDLQIYHDTSNTYLLNSTGNLILKDLTDAVYIQAPQIIFQDETTGENIAKFISDGAVELYHDNAKKLETTSTGINLPGNTDIRLDNGNWTGDATKIQHHNNTLYIQGGSGTYGHMFRDHAGTDRWSILNTGTFFPMQNNAYDIGSSANRVRNIYTNDLHLSNEGHSNDVDGTWGSYTIQEGAEDLFLVNKRNGKKYKFNLTEVS